MKIVNNIFDELLIIHSRWDVTVNLFIDIAINLKYKEA